MKDKYMKMLIDLFDLCRFLFMFFYPIWFILTISSFKNVYNISDIGMFCIVLIGTTLYYVMYHLRVEWVDIKKKSKRDKEKIKKDLVDYHFRK